MIAYVLIPFFVVVLHAAAVAFVKGRSGQPRSPVASGGTWATWTAATFGAVLGALLGEFLVLSVAAGAGGSAFLAAWVGGAVLGSFSGAPVGRWAAAGGKARTLTVMSLLAWMVILLLAGGYLFMAMLGDCFDNVACRANQRAALPNTLRFLTAAAVVQLGVALVLFWPRRGREAQSP